MWRRFTARIVSEGMNERCFKWTHPLLCFDCLDKIVWMHAQFGGTVREAHITHPRGIVDREFPGDTEGTRELHGIDREGRGAASPGCRFIGPSCVSEETGAASCVRPTSSLRTVRDVCPCRANGFAMLRAACSRPPNCTHELGRPREPTDRLR